MVEVVRGNLSLGAFLHEGIPGSTMRDIDLMHAENRLQKRPGAIHPSACINWLTYGERSTDSINLPILLLPVADNQSSNKPLQP